MIPRGKTLDQKRPASLLESESKEVTTPTRKVRVRTSYLTGDAPGSHARSAPEKVRDPHQHDADTDQRDDVRNEIGKNHERNAAQQRHHRALLLAVERKTKPYGAEQQAPQQDRLGHSADILSGGVAPYWLSLWTRKMTTSTICAGPPASCTVTRYLPLTMRV